MRGRPMPLVLDGLNIIGQFKDTRANQRFGRIAAVRLLHVCGCAFRRVTIAPNGHRACAVSSNFASAIDHPHYSIKRKLTPVPLGQGGQVGGLTVRNRAMGPSPCPFGP